MCINYSVITKCRRIKSREKKKKERKTHLKYLESRPVAVFKLPAILLHGSQVKKNILKSTRQTCCLMVVVTVIAPGYYEIIFIFIFLVPLAVPVFVSIHLILPRHCSFLRCRSLFLSRVESESTQRLLNSCPYLWGRG